MYFVHTGHPCGHTEDYRPKLVSDTVITQASIHCEQINVFNADPLNHVPAPETRHELNEWQLHVS